MPIRKEKKIKVVPTTTGRREGGDNHLFYSYDDSSARFVFEFKNPDGTALDLLNATPQALLILHEESGDKKVVTEDLGTISVIDGLVSFVIPDNVLGFRGKCDLYIALAFPDGSSSDEVHVAFTIEESPFNKTYEEAADYYIKSFDVLLKEVELAKTNAINEINEQLPQVQSRLENVENGLRVAEGELEELLDGMNLQTMYSNSTDFGDYDYSGNPNLMRVIKASDFKNENDVVVSDVGYNSIRLTSQGVNRFGTLTLNNIPNLVSGKTYTISAKIKIEEGTTGDIDKLRVSYRKSNGGTILLNASSDGAVVGKEIIIKGTSTINYQITDLSRFFLTIDVSVGATINGSIIVRDIKIEEGSTATPYQPNLLDDPYWLGKTSLGENIKDKGTVFPIKTSAYAVYSGANTEPYIAGQKYTLTMKATKPATQTFNVFLNAETIGVGSMTPVEGLTDVWQKTFTVSQANIDAGVTNRLAIYQVPNSSVGAVQIDWLKIEKGDTRTPNIEQYKYRGIGMRDSNNPKDYVWDLAPEYVEAEVTKKVAQVNSQLKEHVNDTNNPHEVTKNQVGLGNVDNFSTATQTEAEKGEASNKFMTPQRTTQMITKRIATDAEVVAGTDLNKLVTPKSLDIYYRDRTQVAVASYGTEDIALTAKEELSEASWRYRRIGDIVEFYGRFKLKEATDIVNVHELPTGFRLSTDFDDTSWNVPLNIQKAANPTSYVAGAFVERQGTNLLRVGGNSSGNHYVSGWWYTDDPFPTG